MMSIKKNEIGYEKCINIMISIFINQNDSLNSE